MCWPSLLFSGADILDKARNPSVSDSSEWHCDCSLFVMAPIDLALLMKIPFVCFSAHKRFTELLTRDEKDLTNIRVPMEKILTLPELKVRSNETVYDQNSGSVCFMKGPSNKDSVYPECPVLCVFWRERFSHWWIAVTLVFVPVIVQPFQEKNLPRVLDIGTERWEPHVWRLFGPLECIQWLSYSGNQIPLCISHIW